MSIYEVERVRIQRWEKNVVLFRYHVLYLFNTKYCYLYIAQVRPWAVSKAMQATLRPVRKYYERFLWN